MVYLIQSLYNKYKKFNRISKFLDYSKNYLDIGAGDCHFSKLLRDKGYSVAPLDIGDFSRTSIKPVIYEGKKIPFADSSFDTSFLIFVLHHDINNQNLLREAARVTKGRLIIYEELMGNRLELFFTKLFDTFWNKLEGINAPLCFRKEADWEDLFEENGLRVYHKETHRHLEALFTCRYVIYVLDKHSASAK